VPVNELTREIIGAAIEVHKVLGPGLLESTYEQCLCRELDIRRVPYQRQRELPVFYKGLMLDCGKRLGGWTVGLLINFNVVILKQGIRRRVLNFKEYSQETLRSPRLCGELRNWRSYGTDAGAH
jgi:hypothetical protein